ncbi:uncharacterized protein LOC141632748 [Silene latifolia]|uniref:uncharacterized protein LOC141632748 n=1 Tax=Silene latifolia TaxID=37657 RepID=UPI003D785D1D
MDHLNEVGRMHYVHMHRVAGYEKESKEDASWDNGPSGITTNNNNNEDLNLKCLIFGIGSKLGMKDELEEEEEESRRRRRRSTTSAEESSSSSSGTTNWLQLGLPNNNTITSTNPLDLMLDLNLGIPIIHIPSPLPSILSPHPPTCTIHHPPIWFELLPSLPQSVQPHLPHLSKSFLRIKDARMTVGLVMKYLANKLGLHTELQVEIRCRGQVLGASLTLQHVRDYIWSPSYALTTLLPNSSTTPHLMLLHYSSSSTYLPSIQRIY